MLYRLQDCYSILLHYHTMPSSAPDKRNNDLEKASNALSEW
jgi:hypothetical protein